MSDIQRFDLKYNHDDMENTIEPDADGDYVRFHAHDMALAAKDARIAELEAHCKRLGAGDAERYWEGRWRDADAELSRIVAAKDAEIERLKGDVKLPEGWTNLQVEYEPGYPEDVAFGPQRMMDRLKKWLDAYFALRLAQPARQVGGDEDDYMPTGILEAAMYGDIVDTAEVAKAALAPAAVAVVMPEYERNHAGLVAESALSPWNAALDEVARLNRRAIPEGLIKQAAYFLEAHSSGQSIERQIADELRALLGKDC